MTAARPGLEELFAEDQFILRHIGPTEDDIATMLATVGADSLDALIGQAVPADIRMSAPLDLPEARTEAQALAALRSMAEANETPLSLIGMGYHPTVTPPVIRRNLIENPGWYTAYTPYQAEISQGRLEALLNFQQMVMDLTGFDLANASLLDEATAAAEAMAMARRVAKSKAAAFFVDEDTLPQTLSVLRTRAKPMGIRIVTGPLAALKPDEVFGALISYPGASGAIRDPRAALRALAEAKAVSVVASDLLALALLTPPGEMGADICVGSAQRFGVPMGYGGPHAAFFATRDKHKRVTPGRIIGVSLDADGRTALRMALQTREQHIRRDKATSNICTAQALLAVTASMFAVWHGPEGIARIAKRCARLAAIAAAGLREMGFAVAHDAFFETVEVETPGAAQWIADRALEDGVNLRMVSADRVAFAMNECVRRRDLARLWSAFDPDRADDLSTAALDAATGDAIPAALRRESGFLTHPVFNAFRSETEMLRYMRRLQIKDLALDRSMIPLGSCTMKLNAAAEMEPITWPGFAEPHPFAPAEQTRGYARLFQELEAQLCAITGFAAVSLQPNAGSQGEYAGLLAIRRWHEAQGRPDRSVCLIPSSAHGTNPASAVMAGMKVVVVGATERGDIDLDDLRAKADQHRDHLAALMVTYPSTHGVFEPGIREVCEIVHRAGGQVYMDGANLNAMVGLARPGDIGADVCHMNLHKTFCIPHGGGGPGVGPIGVAAHLAPFLPGHEVVANGDGTEGAVAAAPWGSAMILPITWAYISMMGAEGLRRASKVAILSANYIAARLKDHFPVVYAGDRGRVAHECILDLRALRAESGVGVEDVAKRLMDYGFHAPTMSWPVPETLMVEPTESEPLNELDRFCDAMIAIRAEIAEIQSGAADAENNVLRHAPHHPDLLTQGWTRPYTIAQAMFPSGQPADQKYWPPVARVDNVAGDRNLVCACPPMEAYQNTAT